MMFKRPDQALLCPMLNKPCIGDRCMWLIRVLGRNPQTGVEQDIAECSMRALPQIMIENARLVRAAAGAGEQTRDAILKTSADTQRAVLLLAQAAAEKNLIQHEIPVIEHKPEDT